jgi:ABC-type multidrug transport system permease subunit
MDRPPTWRSSATRAGIASVIVAVVLIALGNPVPGALLLAVVALALYIPLGYAFDTFVFRLRQRRKAGGASSPGRSGAGARRRGPRGGG